MDRYAIYPTRWGAEDEREIRRYGANGHYTVIAVGPLPAMRRLYTLLTEWQQVDA